MPLSIPVIQRKLHHAIDRYVYFKEAAARATKHDQPLAVEIFTEKANGWAADVQGLQQLLQTQLLEQ